METKFGKEDAAQEDFLTPQEEVMLDKYRLALNILQKESDLIQQYDYLVRELKLGVFDVKDLKKSFMFYDCWALLSEIYHFMEFNKIEAMKRIYKADVEKLQEIMGKYEDLKEEVSLDDLRQGYTLIRKFVSIAGYHEDIDKLAGSISSFQRKRIGTTEEWDI